MAEITTLIPNRRYGIQGIGEHAAEIVIGGSNPIMFVPNYNISWNCATGNEKYFLNINAGSVIVPPGQNSTWDSGSGTPLKLLTTGRTDLWGIDGETVKWYVEIPEYPVSNIFEWTLLHSPHISFYHQPALTQEEINEGCVRPDDIVNSYAIYCDQKGKYVDSESMVIANYSSGKLGHIFRRKFISGDSNWWWLDSLEIIHQTSSMSLMRVTIPWEILDQATFPAILNDTFGYDTIGGTGYGPAASRQITSGLYSPASNGTATGVGVYCSGSGQDNTTGMYNDSDPETLMSDDGGGEPPASGSWMERSLDSSQAVLSASQYRPSFNGDGSITYQYDDADAETSEWEADTYSSGTLLATLTAYPNYMSREFSAYIIYTVGGGRTTKNADAWNLGQRHGMSLRIATA